MNNHGFTLLECLLVLVLTALLLPPLYALFTTAHRIGAAGSETFYGGIAAQNTLESLRGHRLPALFERISEGIPSCTHYTYRITLHDFVGMTPAAPMIWVVFCDNLERERGYIQGPGPSLPLYFEACGSSMTVSLRFAQTQEGLMAEYTRHGARHQKVFPRVESLRVAVFLSQKQEDVPVQLQFSGPESDSMQIHIYDDARIRQEVVLIINETSRSMDQKWYRGEALPWTVFPGEEMPKLYPLISVEAFDTKDPETLLGRRIGILPTKP